MFVLHEMLEKDTLFVTDWPLSAVRLMNDSRYPWLILVPRVDGARDVHNLAAVDQAQAMCEMATASEIVEHMFETDKTNVAALGNMVPQLHIHVIGRYKTDDAWPGPVWGVHPPLPYDTDVLAGTISKFKSACDQAFD
jgi:diadenosine tetraphosphate (Ap4A) HIT family hydrolase